MALLTILRGSELRVLAPIPHMIRLGRGARVMSLMGVIPGVCGVWVFIAGRGVNRGMMLFLGGVDGGLGSLGITLAG